ncbi:MAG: alginate lyase family protein [Deltaproteobacteria bacterium]|nr:alginate lyase family protein [Deltaproteobacteria bacterium]
MDKGLSNPKGFFKANKKMEFSNYCRQLACSPGKVPGSAYFFSGRVFKRFERMLFKDTTHFYPAYANALMDMGHAVTDARWSFPLIEQAGPFDPSQPAPLGAGTPRVPRAASFDSIEIATGSLKLKDSAIPWDMTFNDPEDLMSLHRWNWLMTKLSQLGPCQGLCHWGAGQIEDWIKKHPKPSDGSVWGAYTICERISNGLLFYLLTGQRPKQAVLRWFLDSLSLASKRHEYHGDTLTGNHIINNARALYLSGRLLDVEGFSRLAGRILEMELPRLVSSEGFLKEGSSHYHFLATRWVLELLWVAKNTGDRKLPSLIEDTVEKMVERSRFFLVRREGAWTMPLIGDISPDFPPDWLIDLPRSGIALSMGVGEKGVLPSLEAGWASLWPEGGSTLPPRPIEGFEVFPESGFSRLDLGRATIFFNPGQPDEPRPAHSHNDTGSFSLFLDGRPLIVDVGRMSYLNDTLGIYGQSALSHNTITVDGFEPDPFPDPHRYPPSYRAEKRDLRLTRFRNGLELFISMRGFQRIAHKYPIVSRSFHARQGVLEICDSFECGYSLHIEARFHVSPEVIVITQGPRTFALSDCSAKATLEALSLYPADTYVIRDGDRGLGGWYFARYGKKSASNTIVFKWDIRPPAKIIYRIGWE